jgi:UTP--glucose-1-phosphate uridylyltransferase
LNENAYWSERARERARALGLEPRPVPLWLMTSEATDEAIRDALAQHRAGPHIATFTQDLGLRLTPEGRLFRDADGEPSTYATGHGDLPDALRRSGLLRDFRARGGKYVWIANLDNLGATLDPVLFAIFANTSADLLVEVAEKEKGDRGGIPVHAPGAPWPQVLEEFRLPQGFDATSVTVFNTNTFLVRAEPLETAPIHYSWFEVTKTVDGKTAIQFERLLQELTSSLPSAYLRVPRHGAEARFLPVKDWDELDKRRPEIEAVARKRGML